MDSFEELIAKVGQWGHDRNLTDPANLKNQFNKLVSEFGEIGEGILLNDQAKVDDGVGDTFVVCIILSHQLQHPLRLVDFERAWLVEDQTHGCVDQATMLLVAAQSKLGLLADNIGKGQIEDARVNLVAFLQCAVSYGYRETSGLYECLQLAYNEIKDRKGVLYHGVFIKESDPRYESARAELGLIERGASLASTDSLNRPPEQ